MSKAIAYLGVLVLGTLFTLRAGAQDTLVMNDGSQVFVKVLEIGETTISYKRSDNKQGPTYTIDQSKVFMAFYKGGRRETFKSEPAARPAETAVVSEPVVTTAGAQEQQGSFTLMSGGFELRMGDAYPVPDKKRTVVSTSVDVYANGKHFVSLSITASQFKNKTLDYTNVNKGYLGNSNIALVVTTEKMKNFLYNKYENFNGKGFGWALPPNFFSLEPSACSVTFLQLRSDNNDMAEYSKVNATKMQLMDCSSLESKILSIVALWLETNFGKK